MERRCSWLPEGFLSEFAYSRSPLLRARSRCAVATSRLLDTNLSKTDQISCQSRRQTESETRKKRVFSRSPSRTAPRCPPDLPRGPSKQRVEPWAGTWLWDLSFEKSQSPRPPRPHLRCDARTQMRRSEALFNFRPMLRFRFGSYTLVE